jgi:hypothetical protein
MQDTVKGAIPEHPWTFGIQGAIHAVRSTAVCNRGAIKAHKPMSQSLQTGLMFRSVNLYRTFGAGNSSLRRMLPRPARTNIGRSIGTADIRASSDNTFERDHCIEGGQRRQMQSLTGQRLLHRPALIRRPRNEGLPRAPRSRRALRHATSYQVTVRCGVDPLVSFDSNYHVDRITRAVSVD